jgi:hypothetical protein
VSSAPAGLRVALLHAGGGGEIAAQLAAGLAALGHRPRAIGSEAAGAVPLAERALAARGFAAGLTSIPRSLAALARDGCDVVHACSEIDAQTALLWRRLRDVPVVFTPYVPPARENLASRRLSLTLATRAFDDSDAVVAPSSEVREGARRWLALELELIDPGDAEGYAALYGRCIEHV